jgi:hypothetical protein
VLKAVEPFEFFEFYRIDHRAKSDVFLVSYSLAVSLTGIALPHSLGLRKPQRCGCSTRRLAFAGRDAALDVLAKSSGIAESK